MYNKALNNEKGVALILVAVSVVVIFGLGALAIDVGHLYNVKNQLQAAADAAALAGASEMTGTTFTEMEEKAFYAADRIAQQNFADVSAQDGKPIPVILYRNQGNDPNGDVVLGIWNGDSFVPSTDPELINAVKVNANRAGAPDSAQPRANNWFAKVFSLLGSKFDASNIGAVAVAAYREIAPMVPIAVNEYWINGGAPYPQSYTRSVNADGSTNARGGETFPILGQWASDNQTPVSVNSFVDILNRNRWHDGRSTDWYDVLHTNAGCSSCMNNLLLRPSGLTAGDVNPLKWGDNFTYLFTGIPDDIIPVNAVREIIRDPITSYPTKNYSDCITGNCNDPSECPFATIPFFDSGGNVVTQDKGPGGLSFADKYPKGSTMMVMVYDGSLDKESNTNQAGRVTVIGYCFIMIDGYWNATWDKISPLKDTGNTAYGHALKHGIAGADDLYLIQPPLNPAQDRTPDCNFVNNLRQVQKKFVVPGSVHLVGPNLKYGMASH